VRFSTSLTVLLLTAIPATPVAETARLLRFELMEDGSIVVPVTIDGDGPFQFMLDTGSTRTAVAEKLAMKLGLATASSSLMITPAGRAVRAVASVDGFALAGMPAVKLDALILPHADFGARTRLDGLVGQDLLAPLVYTIDYTRKVIAWDQSPTLSGRTRLPLQSTGGRLLVSLPQSSTTAAPLRFIPDSGTDGIVLFARTAQPPVPVTPLDIGVLRTVSGHKLVRRVRVDDFWVGDVLLRNQTALMVPADASDELLGDGLLPLHLFARVTFHGPGRYLVVEGRQ
jgi:predicted aspartyl protease